MVQPAIDEGIEQKKKKQCFSAFLFFFIYIEMVTLIFVLYVCV